MAVLDEALSLNMVVSVDTVVDTANADVKVTPIYIGSG